MAKRALQSQSQIQAAFGEPLTIKEHVCHMLAKATQAGFPTCPPWPGDVFAVVTSLLDKSGAYRCVGTQTHPFSRPGSTSAKQWSIDIAELAKLWRRQWTESHTIPPTEIKRLWKALVTNASTPVLQIQEKPDLLRSILKLLAISDECLAGVGLLLSNAEETSGLNGAGEELEFWLFADWLLWPDRKDGSTLCHTIHPSRARVLPKSQTPQTGLTIRSWSHHIALCPPMNVLTRWYSYGMLVGEPMHCNLLLVPWPYHLAPSQFTANHVANGDVHEDANWFRFNPAPDKSGDVVSLVEELVNRATREIGEMHVVVLPELAINPVQYEHLKQIVVLKHGITLVAGVAEEGPHYDRNYVAVCSPESSSRFGFIEFMQNKHHRWRLDRSQIVRYGLSGSLDPALRWWEGIQIEERQLNFLRMREWLSTCILVCEDLARLEPVGQYVRSVAPDLVIALLMDGPQLKQRWPAYYATILADDPGSSVLTLTSLGMTKLSRSENGYGRDSEPVIAMWRDSREGIVEIRLPGDSKAAVLTLTRHSNDELTADGRHHVWDLGVPVFSGVNFL